MSVNHILVEAVSAFNLSVSARDASNDNDNDDAETLGVYDGTKFVFTQTTKAGKLNSWWNNVKILWKYGISPVKAIRLMRSTVDRFLKMYDEPVFPWKQGLTAAAEEVGLLDVTVTTGSQYLEINGISEAFSHDIVQASTRVNYAQNLAEIHGLETMVCLAAEGAMSVEGGNWRIFANMLNASGADVYLKSKVDEIEIGDPDRGLRVAPSGPHVQDYGLDALILAAPYHQTGIKFTPTPAHVPDDIEYVKLHVTLFSTQHQLSPKFFGLTSDDTVPEVILTTQLGNSSEKERHAGGSFHFFSISKLRTIRNTRSKPFRQEHIYKIFSPQPIGSCFLRRLLNIPTDLAVTKSQRHDCSESENQDVGTDDVSWLYRKIWQSYPRLPPRVTFEPQQLDTNLWYTSGIESFISTMETSALAGKNVARLVVDGWKAEA